MESWPRIEADFPAHSGLLEFLTGYLTRPTPILPLWSLGNWGLTSGKALVFSNVPLIKLPAANGPRDRSISMNGYMGDTAGIMAGVNNNSGAAKWKEYLKTSDIIQPGPAMLGVPG